MTFQPGPSDGPHHQPPSHHSAQADRAYSLQLFTWTYKVPQWDQKNLLHILLYHPLIRSLSSTFSHSGPKAWSHMCGRL